MLSLFFYSCQSFLCSTVKLNSIFVFLLLLLTDPKWDEGFTYGKWLGFAVCFLLLLVSTVECLTCFICPDYKSLRTAGLSIGALLFVLGIMVVGCKYDAESHFCVRWCCANHCNYIQPSFLLLRFSLTVGGKVCRVPKCHKKSSK